MAHQELTEFIRKRTQHLLAERDKNAAEPLPILPPLTVPQVAAMIDHTLLKPEATEAQIRQLCQEADTFGFASVCVNPTWIELCTALLAASSAKRCTVIGFPLGATLTNTKMKETEEVIRLGAQEVDMVINVGRLKDQAYQAVLDDIGAVVGAAHAHNVIVKVIIETFLLTEAEKVAATLLTQKAGADFVKTATGFSGGGATVADVRLMRQIVGQSMGIKAAGGIRTGADASQMIAAGATRLGASAGVKIVQSFSNASAPASVETIATRQGENY